jgi:hypothetical protein
MSFSKSVTSMVMLPYPAIYILAYSYIMNDIFFAFQYIQIPLITKESRKNPGIFCGPTWAPRPTASAFTSWF